MRIQPLLPLLRPLAAPRRAACEQFFRFSTATRLRVEEPGSVAKPPNAPSTKDASRQADLAAAEAATDADNANAPAPKPVLPSERPSPSSPQKDALSSSSSSSSTAKTIKSKKGPKATRPRSADDVQPPAGSSQTTSTNLKTTKPKTFGTSTKAKISSKNDPTAPRKPVLDLPPPKYHVARSKSKNLPIYSDYKRGGNLHLTTIRKVTGDTSALRDELRVFLNKKNEDVKINPLNQHVVVKGHHVPQINEFLTARGM